MSRYALLAIVATLAACKPDRKTPPSSPSAAPAIPSPPSMPRVPPQQPTRGQTAPAPVPSAIPSAIRDGGVFAGTCRLLYGPVQQAWRGPAVLRAEGDGVDVVFNDDGTARTVHVPGGPIDPHAKPATVVAAGEVVQATSPPCAIGGKYFFCASKDGDVWRTARSGGPPKVVGAHRAGYRIDATTIGGDHALLAYLASRKTSEGWVSEAWAVVDEKPPMRISEDGSGATEVDLAPRGSSVVAMLLDARRASTQMHARILTYAATLDVGLDAVVFIGGPGERRTAGVMATPQESGSANGSAYALLPIAEDVMTFGMAAIRIDETPVVQSPVVWSAYPNGLDPAPIAATQGHTPMRVARVRPIAAAATSDKVLEIGRIEPDGSFTAQSLITTHGAATDVALDTDAAGALWIIYTDGAGTWLERRTCA